MHANATYISTYILFPENISCIATLKLYTKLTLYNYPYTVTVATYISIY